MRYLLVLFSPYPKDVSFSLVISLTVMQAKLLFA